MQVVKVPFYLIYSTHTGYMQPYTITHLRQTLHLHPMKGLYWQEQDMLLVADAHLGKARHFRKAGIAVPMGVAIENLRRLEVLLAAYEPGRVMFMGDLFHSTHNAAWEEFNSFCADYADVSFELIKGNHDILTERHYEESLLTYHSKPLRIGPYLLSHEPMEVPGSYNLCGHIHPGVVLGGWGKQRMRLSCFYFGLQGCILPAFGAFTGLANVRVQRGERVFVVTDEAVLPVD